MTHHAASTHGNLATLTLEADGTILECSEEMVGLSGYKQHELHSRHVSSILPGLTRLSLLDENGINPKLHYLFLADFPFRLRRHDSEWCYCKMHVIDLDNTSPTPRLRIKVSPAPAASYAE